MKHFGLSEDEIIRDWSLHTEDLAFVRKFRKQYQLWIYLQVCSLKLFGQMTGFTKHFTPIHGQKGKPKNFYKTLIASILAQATNIGLATMQDCAPGITAKMMRGVTDTCIREASIKAANAELVNHHTQLDLSQNYGDGKMSSSDGQRFIITASSLLSSYYPRYAGYYDKMIGVYTHTSNQLSVINTQAISCAPRESLYVIDGLLDNNTILAIK